MKFFEITFGSKNFEPLNLEEGVHLSEHLTVENSPILFGCRTGICGTCLIDVMETKNGEIPPPTPQEGEVLNLLADHCPRARLACQLKACADMRIQMLDEDYP